jgi:hypothetical protein
MTATPKRSFARKLAAAVLVTGTGFGLATVAATPAMADTGCRLDFFHDVFDPPNTWRIAFPCNPDVVVTNAMQLWGEDPFSDDFIGNTFHPGDLLDSGRLDEDWGEDEIYAKVTVFQNGIPVNVRSNTVHRSF